MHEPRQLSCGKQRCEGDWLVNVVELFGLELALLLQEVDLARCASEWLSENNHSLAHRAKNDFHNRASHSSCNSAVHGRGVKSHTFTV